MIELSLTMSDAAYDRSETHRACVGGS